ncbi:MAG: bifunctional diaminohydroxyphosphoribosylaminopyrimidine deaminase/5-amino-6-(5-phosphoribosylamino)uracil reductase RibD [Sulfurimonas sp.]|nr:bifunctional diaminohydroxyphosphoribosylaminopyrimidine deaminase/5-amino-6-(5-phosphoribosylamino)uracil reductase RibD [Sulfurimonas sp.]
MNLALREAWKYQGLTYPNPAVGCAIVGQYGELLAVNAHQKAGEAHAEVLALKDAYLKLTNDITIVNIFNSAEIHAYLLKNHHNCFANTSLYTTLEPCSHIGKTPSCASLIAALGIQKIYVGANDTNKEAANGNSILEKSGICVESRVLRKECENLLLPFGKWQEKNFVFFKWAQRLSGTIDDGIISSKNSRKNVHAMRSVCDLIVIGGDTVRNDRPTLDARLVDGKAPDVLIISRQKEFDRTIPLFGVAGRNVFIYDNFSKLDAYKNIMIEGGPQMYALAREHIDLSLCYIAPKFGGKEGFADLDDYFEILNIEKDEQDIIMWMKKGNTI